MKLCCNWCSAIFTPHDPSLVREDPRYGKIYCSIGCRDANTLFYNYIQVKFADSPDFDSKRIRRLK